MRSVSVTLKVVGDLPVVEFVWVKTGFGINDESMTIIATNVITRIPLRFIEANRLTFAIVAT